MCTPEKLLVVDDDAYNRDMLSRRLIRRGYDVAVAGDGAEALSLIEQDQFDLVLLDNMMPGMSGMDLLKLLRATYSETALPVIMVTAQSQSENIVQALEAGANDYIVKPVDFPVAAARIQNELTRKTASDALRESEERYSLAARGANDGLWDWDVKRGRVYYSPGWKSMMGFGDSDLSEHPEEWFTRICEIDRKRVRGAIEQHLRGGQAEFICEYRVTHRDGTIRWMRSRAVSSRDRTGAVTRLTGSQSDVTTAMTTDPLTGLPNRDFLMGEITRSVGAAASFALLVLDLDGFKLINDSLGHLTGDQLLKFAAERLRESCTQHMKTYPATRVEPARLGGDEFAVLLVGHGDSEPQQLAGCVIREISKPFHFEGRDVFTGASIGIAFGARSYNTGEEIVRDADTAMYRAKTCGRGRFEIFEATMRARTVARLELETELRHAVARSELEVYYQPKVDLRSGSIIGFEALSRWFHPRRGFIGPSEFIPVAEETGLIIAIGMWALTQGCRQMREWQRVEPLVNKLTLSVNLSPRQFSEPALCDEITRVLEETGYDPRGLCLEITESVLAEDLDRASETLQRLKSMGIGLKLDDFGTGYSSLNYLCRLPFDTLKIDRSFVMRMHDSQEAAGIVKTIVALANDLHMDIVAEGIETPEQYTRLRELGCQYGQGFYFGRPVPPAETTVLIQRLTSCNVLPSVNNGHKSHGD